MVFGAIFRGWVATLHQDVSAAFLLHNVSPCILILFSIRQGDPWAAHLFVIYLEPFLVRLEANLQGLQVAHFRGASSGLRHLPTFSSSVEATWDRVQAGIRSTVRTWASRCLPTLIQRVQVLEVFISSKVWFFAQVLPLPAAAAASLNRILGDFVWAHSLARLAFPQIHQPFSQGGLGLCNPAMRAQSLLVKQVFHQMAAGGQPALHLSYWMVTAL